ncbi:hypothetical protein [Sphingomonas sp. MS122]
MADTPARAATSLIVTAELDRRERWLIGAAFAAASLCVPSKSMI